MNMTRYSPLDDILKACAYQCITFIAERMNKVSDFHIQRLEYISQEEEEVLDDKGNVVPTTKFVKRELEPIPFFTKDQKYPDMVCMISNIPNRKQIQQNKNKSLFGSKSASQEQENAEAMAQNSSWVGDVWFLKNPYVYHINLVYPPMLVKVAEEKKKILSKHGANKQAAEAEFATFVNSVVSSYTNKKDLQEQLKKMAMNASSDPKEITEHLRTEMIKIIHNSFYKRFTAL